MLDRIHLLSQGLHRRESSPGSGCLDLRSQTCACNLLQIISAMPAEAFNRSTQSRVEQPRIGECTQTDGECRF